MQLIHCLFSSLGATSGNVHGLLLVLFAGIISDAWQTMLGARDQIRICLKHGKYLIPYAIFLSPSPVYYKAVILFYLKHRMLYISKDLVKQNFSE